MYLKIKRIIDLFLAIILLVLLLPFFIIIIIGLKINKINKVIFIQKRSGINDTLFNIYKFRTIDDNNQNKFCYFLRHTGLDELPQLLNIIKGEMSFVGPRPWIVEYSSNFTRKQKQRLNILPGITGLAQVSECRNIFEKIDKDIEYVNNVSFILDIKIVLKTFKVIFTNSKNEMSNIGIEDEIELLKKQFNKNKENFLDK